MMSLLELRSNPETCDGNWSQRSFGHFCPIAVLIKILEEEVERLVPELKLPMNIDDPVYREGS